ncbi:unnamed protein product [Ambrosiozyma monospora]|uniref:Unnamed protein product n=1 Tax=Ambrosiozyma monospora TaxID=43982 RepID=A0ACB5SZL5_AMBMO|nr:unnamed protein product [Ambrosiozyma monospora]
MKILATADDSGSLKLLECYRGTDTSKQTATQPRSITTHCTESRSTKILQFIVFENKYIIATRLGGTICIYNLDNYELINKFGGLTSDDKENFISLFQLDDLCYACTNNGQVIIMKPDVEEKQKEKYPIKIQLPGCSTGNVSCFKNDPYHEQVFGYGGKENDLMLVKLSTESPEKIETLFKAKNVKNSHLDLRVPIHITKLDFVKPANEKDFNVITVTKYGELRIYDSSKSRKPIASMKISEHSIISLLRVSDEEIVCSDDHTTIAKYSTVNGRLLGKFKGSVGSIQASCQLGKVIATGGLDRYVRVFDLDSRECIVKCYMTTHISGVLILEDDKNVQEEVESAEREKRARTDDKEGEDTAAEESEQESSDEEEMWARLETNKVVEKRKRRKLELKSFKK